MRQYSVDNNKQKILDLFSNIEYEAEINGDFLDIKGQDGEKQVQIKLIDDFEAEMSTIKNIEPFVVAGEGFISFILFDSNDEFDKDEITLNGEVNGNIIKDNFDEYGVLYSNLHQLIDTKKFLELIRETDEIQLNELISEKIIIVDINFEPGDAFYDTNDSKKIESLIDSILVSLKYHYNITLINPRNNYEYEKTKDINLGNVEVKVINHIEPMKYFLSAEEISSPHLKYLEYYHVLEYYFMYTSIKEFDRRISELLSLKLAGKKFNDGDYYNLMQSSYKHFSVKDSTKEEVQIKNLFTQDIGYSPIAEYVNDNLEDVKVENKKTFLQKEIYDIPETLVSSYNNCKLEGNTLKLHSSITLDKSNVFCNEIAVRVYKIRNFIVHTKKGERKNVFTPSNKYFEDLERDLKFIRYLSWFLLLKMSHEN